MYTGILTWGAVSVAVVEFFIKYFWRRKCLAIEGEEERTKSIPTLKKEGEFKAMHESAGGGSMSCRNSNSNIGRGFLCGFRLHG